MNQTALDYNSDERRYKPTLILPSAHPVNWKRSGPALSLRLVAAVSVALILLCGAKRAFAQAENTAYGTDALIYNTGSYNSAFGSYVLNYNASGEFNTGVGATALSSNTTGNNNTAVGSFALDVNNGDSNTSVGSGALSGNTTGAGNTAVGAFALQLNAGGGLNSAFGFNALTNSVGSSNTAVGAYALDYNTTGQYNSASGQQALYANTQGNYGTAVGYFALLNNLSGNYNNAFGAESLALNTLGSGNSAVGFRALYSNVSGDNNSAIGYNALFANTTGTFNNASGYDTLASNISGGYNNGMGVKSLYSNTTGSFNNAMGYGALYSNSSGNTNSAIGYYAGFNLTTGSNNIDISNRGVAGESGVIRIGVQGTQTAAYLAGVYGSNVTSGASVVVDSSGHLGVTSSSVRYKEDIQPMGTASERLYGLRPVTFRYRQADSQGKKPVQYGLIAEEVASVMPELVVYNADGRPETVAYQTLSALLLNELQKSRHEVVALRQQLAGVAKLRAELAELKAMTRGLAARVDAESKHPALVARTDSNPPQQP